MQLYISTFLSTLSLRRATSKPRLLKSRRCVFLSTLSLRRATTPKKNQPGKSNISIHALLAESDWSVNIQRPSAKNFYPRSPCGERPRRASRQQPAGEFLSTLSLRRATQQAAGTTRTTWISIHALLAESDAEADITLTGNIKFLSTLSLRRATRRNQHQRKRKGISIHALLAESDHSRRSRKQRHPHFYPRSPCGERQPAEIRPNLVNNFYPRSPCGERHGKA